MRRFFGGDFGLPPWPIVRPTDGWRTAGGVPPYGRGGWVGGTRCTFIRLYNLTGAPPRPSCFNLRHRHLPPPTSAGAPAREGGVRVTPPAAAVLRLISPPPPPRPTKQSALALKPYCYSVLFSGSRKVEAGTPTLLYDMFAPPLPPPAEASGGTRGHARAPLLNKVKH